MYELIKVGLRTYYINCPSKIGVYITAENQAVLIDSGNDKDAGRKILKILNENGWTLKCILNTHSNADHVGGNAFLQQRTSCEILGTGIENAFTSYPILEASFLYGGFPNKDLRNKFLMAVPSNPTGTLENSLPPEFEMLPLNGHFFGMAGIKTPDGVWFLADCLFGENILTKYHVFFVYDVAEFLNTLDMLEQLEGTLFVPSHADAVTDLSLLIQANRSKILQICDELISYCKEPAPFEKILKYVFDTFELHMDFNQYVLVGSTIRSYLSYLYDQGKLTCTFEDNLLFWQAV